MHRQHFVEVQKNTKQEFNASTGTQPAKDKKREANCDEVLSINISW